MFFPPCQVRVVKFYISCPPPPPPSPPPPPDLNCKLVIAVVPARPEQQTQDQSGPCRASTASSWSLPDPNSKPRSASWGSEWSIAGAQLQALGPCRARTANPGSEWSRLGSTASSWSLPDPNSKPRIRVVLAGPQLQARDRSGPRWTQTATSGSK